MFLWLMRFPPVYVHAPSQVIPSTEKPAGVLLHLREAFVDKFMSGPRT
jgi:hypothetical protein